MGLWGELYYVGFCNAILFFHSITSSFLAQYNIYTRETRTIVESGAWAELLKIGSRTTSTFYSGIDKYNGPIITSTEGEIVMHDLVTFLKFPFVLLYPTSFPFVPFVSLSFLSSHFISFHHSIPFTISFLFVLLQ